MNSRPSKNGASSARSGVPAGRFSEWLRGTEAALRSGTGGADVPCGTCKGCCRSSMFIHIEPQESQTLQRIPRALLFPAPGRPKGHLLLGYNDKGECPMFVDERCSIYEDRPRTCREYDCRVFAATGIAVDRESQPEIAERVEAWVFQFESEESRKEYRILQWAAAFLQERRDLFPPGFIPNHPGPLAALAVRICRLFAGIKGAVPAPAPAVADAEIARLIVAELNEPPAEPPGGNQED
jgi:Fe-S-cluster containining protein